MKKNLCVIFGGESPEHDISQKSVTSVLKNLNKEKYNIYTIGITLDAKCLLFTGDYSLIENGEWEKDTANLTTAFISPDSSQKGIAVFENPVRIIHVDVIFPVLHGE